MTGILITLALILLLLGLLGIIHPAIPGLPIMFGGIWLLAYAQEYTVIGSTALWLMVLVTLLGVAMDYLAGLLGAKFTGASKTALWCALLGGIVGIMFGFFGIILGPLLGAAVGEFWARRDLLKASKVGLGTFCGFLVGVVAKIGCALVMCFTVLGCYIYSWVYS